MTVANLICQYTLPDDVVLIAEFICGDGEVIYDSPDVVVRRAAAMVCDFDCDDVEALADSMIHEGIEQSLAATTRLRHEKPRRYAGWTSADCYGRARNVQLVEAAGIEPASEDPTSPALHA